MLRLVCALILSAMIAVASARADSWLMPVVTTYESADVSARFTVTPRDIQSQLSYFEGRAQGEPPHGLLEIRDDAGQWSRVWDGPLVNEVAPVRALVAPAGRYVVTFDNWHMVGFGENVVVIYDVSGRVVRSLSLADLLPPGYIEALPRSVSSMAWGGEHRLLDDVLLLQIVVPGEDARTYVELPIELSTGRVKTPQTAAWAEALAQGERVAANNRASAARADAAFRAPLVAPATPDEREWHLYLVELFFRLRTSDDPGYPAVDVLRSPQRGDYAASEGWLCEKFHEESGPDLMLASPASPENLLRVVRQCLQSPYAAALERIYVVIPLQYRASMTDALAPTRAEIITLDPTTPVPQRPERIARRDRR